MKYTPKDIIERIESASAFEEKSVPIYSNHIAQALLQSGLDPLVRREISAKLALLADESRGHIVLLRHIRQLYEQSLQE